MADDRPVKNDAGPRPAGRRDGGITLSALRTFVAVAEAGSVSRAAEAIGVSQPTVSIQLGGLESACGVLLVRRKPSVALTDAGQDLFVRARLILGRLDEFEDSVAALRGLRRGRLSIGMSAPHVAMPLLAAFVASHEAITVTASNGNTATLLDQVARCRIDVGVMTLLAPEPGFECVLLARPRLAVCVPRGHPLASRASVRTNELARLPLLLREPGSMTRHLFETVLATEGVAPRVTIELGSRESVKEGVAAGLGVAVMFDDEVERDTRLVAVPLAGRLPGSGVYAVVSPESLEIPVVRAFVDQAVVSGARRPARSAAGSARTAAASRSGPSPPRR